MVVETAVAVEAAVDDQADEPQRQDRCEPSRRDRFRCPWDGKT